MNLLFILVLVAPILFSNATVSIRQRILPGTQKVGSSASCLTGDGSSYRGSVSVSNRGRQCLNWDKFVTIGTQDVSLGLGSHNYCRNPDQSLHPWCRVRRGRRIVRQFCNVPKCETDSQTTTSVPDTPDIPNVDTERTCGEKVERRFKIVGGLVTHVESQPWTATIFLPRNRFLCGGSLIAPCWVLTAAHCFSPSDPIPITAERVTVTLGKSSIKKTDPDREQKFAVEQIILHQDYNDTRGNQIHDIALLKLRSKDGVCAVRTDAVRTVCLPPPLTMLAPGAVCTATGHGKEKFGAWEHSENLKQTEVAIVSQSLCSSEDYYGNLITKDMMCAASPDWSTDSCEGDSGGPLTYDVSGRTFLFGIVSWGDGCAQKNKPGVYTRTTNYNGWIAEKTGLPEFTAGIMYPVK